ncbi:BofC C-terminal domain-containing protein [Bacillus infantis]|uniref:BofC C-terminal domain-containing protein n=1 Tax=Bacillus infantis TaxID=324767 RepID=UPI003CEDF90A
MRTNPIRLLASFLLIAVWFAVIAGTETGIPVQASESGPLELSVILERVYLDGEMSEEEIQETVWSLEDFWSKYDEWQLVEMDEGQMVFRQSVDDISPLLKSNGYFGLTDEGILTIYNGRPDKSRIIQSFFQIDIRKLESKKREQLEKGIPIMTKNRYAEVLEAFQSYSISGSGQ